MKILAIMGSPNGKGSGYKIVKMIEDRMKAMGDVEFVYLFLKDTNLKSCIGCYTCMAKGVAQGWRGSTLGFRHPGKPTTSGACGGERG